MVYLRFRTQVILTFVCVGLCTFFGNIRPQIVERVNPNDSTGLFLLIIDLILNIVAHIALHFLHRETRITGRKIWSIGLIVYRTLFAIGTLTLIASIFA